MKKISLADKCILGFIMLLGMAEAGHLLMVFGNRPFSDAVILFCVMALLVVVMVAAWCIWDFCRDIKHPKTSKTRNKSISVGICCAIFVLIVLYQIMTIVSEGSIYRTGDMTVETVQNILHNQSVYQTNPLTGMAYSQGVPMRIKVLGLPTFYAMLCQIFRLPAVPLVEKIIPIVVLLLCYLAYWTVACGAFREKKDLEKRLLFMVAVAAILCASDYAFGMDGFGILHCGYRGTTLRSAILLPYTFGLVLRRQFLFVPLCVLGELCIVWTLYGMGQCFFVAVAMGIILLSKKKQGSELHILKKEEQS